jgi:predicted acyl esterase
VNLGSHLVQRMQELPPPLTRDLTVERDLRVPMRDGAVLLADHWTPKTGGDGLPTALVRALYARASTVADQMMRPLVERGFQMVIQSTRGTFGSDGTFDPMRREREDGLDTIDWVIKQPWFGESMVLVGGSYLGFVQWAVADAIPPQVKAMIPAVSESALTLEFLRSDGFSLETPFGWGVMVTGQERRFALPPQLLADRKVQRALYTLPLNRGMRRPSAAARSTSRTSSRTTPTTRSGRPPTTGTGSPTSPRPRAWWATGTTSSCPASTATTAHCRTPGFPRSVSPSAPGLTPPSRWADWRRERLSASACLWPGVTSRPNASRCDCS